MAPVVCEEDAAYQEYREQRGWSIEPLFEASQRGWFWRRISPLLDERRRSVLLGTL
jgi:hypothetical protein